MEETINGISWPPAYKLKKHRRARHVKITPSKKHGLEILTPYRFSKKELPAILELHKDWIIEQLVLIQAARTASLPETVNFPAIAQTWHIRYIATEKRMRVLESPMQVLTVYGKIDSIDDVRKKLIDWFKLKAKEHLQPILETVSQRTNLPYATTNVRDQKTQWGSCSAGKVINLNYRLIFLPQVLVHHIMVHELCHTVHLNHSRRFWSLVARHDAAWHENRRALRHADKHLPAWL